MIDSKKAAFMGKITAGVTHEIKNVLAIIKESAGLIEDLISLSKENCIPQQDRFIRSLSRIADQVARGVELSSRLNTFAHTPDESLASVDLNHTIAQAAFLCQRFARLQGMTLATRPNERAPIALTDPLGLQMLLFECVMLMIDCAQNGAAIILEIREIDEKTAAIEAAVKGPTAEGADRKDPANLPGWPIALDTARGLGLVLDGSSQPPRITVRFPTRA